MQVCQFLNNNMAFFFLGIPKNQPVVIDPCNPFMKLIIS